LFAKVNGKDVIGGPMLHNISRFDLQEIAKDVVDVDDWLTVKN